MQKASLRRIFILAGIFSLLVSYVGIWLQFITDPVERTGSDFIAFYSVGRIAQRQGTTHIYDPELQQDVQEDLVGFSLAPRQLIISQHFPYLLPILMRITSPDYVVSFYKWISLMILIYIAGVMILTRILKKAGLDKDSIALAAYGGILFYPFFFSLMNGQDTALLFLGAAIWVFALLSGKELMAGLGLSLVTIRPHIVILLALPMFWRYRKVFWGFVLGSGGLALYSYLMIGTQGTQDLINLLLISAGGEGYALHEDAMMNLVGLLLRLLPQLPTDITHVIGWVAYGIAFLYLCIRWGRNRDLRDGRIGLTITLALFVAPHLHFHDLTLLLLPVYEWIWISKENEHPKTSLALLLPLIVSFLLLLGNLSSYLQYTIPYLIMLALAGWRRIWSGPFFTAQDANAARKTI